MVNDTVFVVAIKVIILHKSREAYIVVPLSPAAVWKFWQPLDQDPGNYSAQKKIDNFRKAQYLLNTIIVSSCPIRLIVCYGILYFSVTPHVI